MLRGSSGLNRPAAAVKVAVMVMMRMMVTVGFLLFLQEKANVVGTSS